MIFPGVTRAMRERADRDAHPVAGFFGRSRFLQERPGDAQMLAMVKILVADLPAFESAREFAIGDAIRRRRPAHRYYDIVISGIGQ